MVALLAAAVSAQGSRLTARPPEAISRGVELPESCPGLFAERRSDVELEPHAATSPIKGRRLAVAWIEGSAQGIAVASSADGGRNWRTTVPPGPSACTGGEFEGAADPWLTYDAGGVAYLASIPADFLAPPLLFRSQIVANESFRGGRRFSEPREVEETDEFNDKVGLSADPEQPGLLYAAFSKRTGIAGESGSLYFTSSRDGGRTWVEPVLVYGPPPLLVAVNGHVLPLPGGRLAMVFDLITVSDSLPGENENVPYQVMASVSDDGGRSWSAPVGVGTVPEELSRAAFPDEGGRFYRTPGISSHAVAPRGWLYAAWATRWPDQRGGIAVARSRDGVSWSEPAVAARVPGLALQPTIASARDGTIGVSYFNFSRDRPGDDQRTTRVRLAYARGPWGRWRTTRLARSFDYRRAPRLGSELGTSYFLGDYFGLTARGRHGLLAALALPAPGASSSSDIYAVRVMQRTDRSARRGHGREGARRGRR